MSILSVQQKIIGKTYIEAGRIIFDAWKNNELTDLEKNQMSNMYEVWTGGNQIVQAPFTTTTQARAEIYEETGEYQQESANLIPIGQVVANLIAKQQPIISPAVFTSTTTTTTTTQNIEENQGEDESLFLQIKEGLVDYGQKLTDINNLKSYGNFLGEFLNIVGEIPVNLVSPILTETTTDISTGLKNLTGGISTGLTDVGTGLGSGLKETGSGLGSGLNNLIIPAVVVFGGLYLLKN